MPEFVAFKADPVYSYNDIGLSLAYITFFCKLNALLANLGDPIWH